jgi:hypothetical protein
MNLEPLLPESPESPKAVLYSYIDGSGNAYYITKNLTQYNPMTAKYSSSGFYDGGEAAKIVLPPEQFEAIRVIIQQVQQNESDHIPNRLKESGKICLHQQSETFILGYSTTSKKELETILKKIMTT